MITNGENLDFIRHLSSLWAMFGIKQLTRIRLMTIKPILNGKSLSDIIDCLI